ncbi:MAG: hypothetical protein ABIA91_01145, partial [Patescibacteria group bacterium]
MSRRKTKQIKTLNSTSANRKGFICLSEAANKCNYSQEYLSLLARRRLLKAEKIGRNWFTKIEWLKKYIEDHPSDLKGNIKGKFISKDVSKNTVKLFNSKKYNKNLKRKVQSKFEYFKKFFLFFFVWKNVKYRALFKKFVLVSCMAGLLLFSVLLYTNQTNIAKFSEKVKGVVKEQFSPLQTCLKDFIGTEVKLVRSGFGIVKETVGEELFGNTIENISGAIYDIYNISTQGTLVDEEVNVQQTFLAGGFQKIAGAKDQQKYLNFFTKATEVKNISQKIAKDLNDGSSVKKYFAKLDKKILDTKFEERVDNVLSNKEYKLAVKTSLEEIFDLKFFEIGDQTEKGLTVAGNIALKGIDKTGNVLRQTPKGIAVVSQEANKIFDSTIMGLQKFSSGMYNITVKPVAKFGEWTYKQPINLVKSLGLKIGESRNNWLNDYIALQDSYLYLLKNQKKGGQTTVVYEGDYVVHQTPEQPLDQNIVYVKGPKGEKGDTGKQGSACSQCSTGSDSSLGGGHSYTTNIYNVAEGSSVSDGAGSSFSIRYLGADTLSVSGDAEVNGALTVGGATTFESTVSISGDLTASGSLSTSNISGAGYISMGPGTSDWTLETGDAYFSDDLEIDGSIRVDTATTTEPAIWVTSSPLALTTTSLVMLGPNNLSSASGNGTFIGANPITFAGDFINFQVDGSTRFKVDSNGNLTAAGLPDISGSSVFNGPVYVTTSTAPQLTVQYDSNNQWQSLVDAKGNLTWDLTSATNTPEFTFSDPINISTTTSVDIFNITASSTQNIIDITSSSTDPLIALNQTGAGSALQFASSPQASSTIALLQLTSDPMVAGSVNGTFIAANPSGFSGNFLDFQIAGTRYFSLASDGDIFTRGGILMSVNSTTAVAIRDANDNMHFVIDTTQGHYGFATSSPADGYGLTIATSTLQYGGYYNFGNATTSGTGVFNVSLAVATTTHPYALNVSGDGYFTGGVIFNSITTTDTAVIQGLLTAQNGAYINASTTITANATTTGNFTANDTLYVKDGKVGIGIASPAAQLHITNDARIPILNATSSLFDYATTSGSFVAQNDVTLGDATTDRIAINSYFLSDLIPADNTRDVGSSVNRWSYGYFDNFNVNTLSAGGTDISGTASNEIVINSSNVTDDLEDSSIVFERGAPVTNAAIRWDASENFVNFNFPIWVEGTDSGGSASSTIVVKEGVNQGSADLFKLLNISDNILLRADAKGHLALGSSYQNNYGFSVATTTYIEGQCVTGDTLLPIVTGSFDSSPLRSDSLRMTAIRDIKGGEYVMSLNEKTGLLEPAKIKGLLDMGVKPIYKLTTESGKEIRTTGNHPYLTQQGWTKVAYLQEGIKIAVQNDRNVENFFEVENKKTAKISDSLESINLMQNSGLSPVDNYITDKDDVKFSSQIKTMEVRGIEPPNSWMISQSSHQATPMVGSLYQKNSTSSIKTDIIFEKTTSEDVIPNNSEGSRGQMGIVFEKIIKIELLPSEQVYDIEVEGTHNFVANGIIAHNTYINSSLSSATTTITGNLNVQDSDATSHLFVDNNTGNVGIGTTAPGATLHVSGTYDPLYVSATSGKVAIFDTAFQGGYGFTVATSTYIEGQCVTGDTLLPIINNQETITKKTSNTNNQTSDYELVRIDEIKGGEYVMSLNE